MGVTQLQSKGLLCTLGLLSVAIAGAGDTQHMPVALKALSVRSVIVFTELRTTGSWLGVAMSGAVHTGVEVRRMYSEVSGLVE